MKETGHILDRIGIHGLSLFECCRCHSSKQDPVQLNCLHYYCLSCLNSSDSRQQGLKLTVTCPACTEVSESSAALTNQFLSTYKHATALRAEIVWCNTCDREAKEVTSDFWCVVCAEALCVACYVRHNRFASGHRIFDLELARTLPLSQLTRSAKCNLHMRPMEAHCFTCCLPKCIECLEACTAGSHDMHLLSDKKSREYMSRVKIRMKDIAERLGSLLPSILQKHRTLSSRLCADRSRGHKLLVNHRRLLCDSVVRTFDEAAAKVCDVRQGTPCDNFDVMVRCTPRRCATNIKAMSLSGARNLQFVGIRSLLKTVAAYRCLPRRASIRMLQQSYKQTGTLCISGSLPLTSDIALSACLGATVRKGGTQLAPLRFVHQAIVNFETTVDCYDVAATRDGHVLLAALQHGLLVYSDRGQQLSTWRPARRCDGEDDWVRCVAALSDRAAVGVFWARLVVLLRHSETDDTWLEDHRVVELQSPPRSLAVHGDLLAAGERRRDEQHQRWVAGPEVKILRLRSGQLLYTQKRDYDIDSLALTALCLVTKSRDPVKHNSGAKPYVLEAFSHSGVFLWRHETSDDEVVTGVCVSADTWSRVYVILPSRDGSRSSVMAIGGADGRDTREVMNSKTHGLQLTAWMSLARWRQQTVLAVLSWDSYTVSLYEAIGE